MGRGLFCNGERGCCAMGRRLLCCEKGAGMLRGETCGAKRRRTVVKREKSRIAMEKPSCSATRRGPVVLWGKVLQYYIIGGGHL